LEDLGRPALRVEFVDARIAALPSGGGNFKMQGVAIQGTFVLDDSRVATAATRTGHLKGDVVAIYFAVGDFRWSRRSPAATATAASPHHRGNAAGEFGAVGLQGNGDRNWIATTTARLLVGPFAGYVRRDRDERNDKQNRRYKKQLFGHSTTQGVAGIPDGYRADTLLIGDKRKTAFPQESRGKGRLNQTAGWI